LPGIFPPVQLGDRRLVDGGVLNNLPVDHARSLCADVVIGVDVQLNPYHEPPWQDMKIRFKFLIPFPDFFLDLYRAELIMIAKLTLDRLREAPPDFLLTPPIAPDVPMLLGFSRAAEVIAAGEAATAEIIPQLRVRLAEVQTANQ